MRAIQLKDIHRMRNVIGEDKINPKRYKKFFEYLDDAGRIGINPQINLGPYDGITNAWKNEPAIVIGSGPSLKGFDFERIKNIHSIGINHVIEDFDGFEWFIFLDRRFLNKTTYDMTKYTGKVICQNNCPPIEGLDTVFFKTIKHNNEIDLDIKNGLYKGSLTSLVAVHLALISGASPIFLIGCDCGGGTFDNYHYKKNYTGATKTKEKWVKYNNTAAMFNKFKPWADRIINLSSISNIKTFKKDDIENYQILRKKQKKIQIQTNKTICHMISMENMSQMGDISRYVYEKGIANHIFCNINTAPPMADIYFLECFIRDNQKYVNFQRPHKKAKIISLVHSSSSCMPSKNSDKIITITQAWNNIMKTRNIESIVIPAGIDISLYNHAVDYDKQTFGRITRYSSGKIHPEWNNVVKNILDKNDKAKCIMYTRKDKRLLQHERMIIDDSIKINELEKKAKKLSELTIFADMHNTFVETFSLCLLEAMATGLCCIMLSKNPQPAMREVLGNAGIWCNTPLQFEQMIEKMLKNPKAKKEWGKKAKKRAKLYSIERMIERYNNIFLSVLKN